MRKTRQNIFIEGLAVSVLAVVSLLTKPTGNLILQQEGAWLTNVLVTHLHLSSLSSK